MKVIEKKQSIFLIIAVIMPFTLFASQAKAGSFGAEIFCTMRDGGNEHESSWEAAYSYIKKQKGGIFKVSPKQAAAQIVETVVREKDKFGYCIEYLDKLHPDRQLARDLKKEEERKAKEIKENKDRRKQLERELEDTNTDYSEETFDRYSY